MRVAVRRPGTATTGLGALDATTQMGCCLWVLLLGQAGGTMVPARDYAAQYGSTNDRDGFFFRTITTPGTLQLRIGTAAGASTITSPRIPLEILLRYSPWVHLGVTYDGASVCWYCNGIMFSRQSDSTVASTGGTRRFQPGSYAAGNGLGPEGVHDLRWWNQRTPTQADIRAAMEGTPLDEAARYYLSDSTGRDWTGQGNDLTSQTNSGLMPAPEHLLVGPGGQKALAYYDPIVVAPSSGSAQVLTPAAAVVTISAIAPSLAGAGVASLTPAAAAVAVSGVTPGLSGSGTVALTPAAAAVSVSGVAPALAGSGVASLQPAAAIVTVSGVNPTVTGAGAAGVAPAAAIVSIVGVNPVLSSGAAPQTLAPAAASVTVTVPTPTLAAGVAFLTPAAAQVTITAPSPALAPGGIGAFAPAPAIVTVTAQTPLLFGGIHFVLECTDVSGPRYAFADASGNRYEFEDVSAPQYAFADRSVQ